MNRMGFANDVKWLQLCQKQIHYEEGYTFAPSSCDISNAEYWLWSLGIHPTFTQIQFLLAKNIIRATTTSACLNITTFIQQNFLQASPRKRIHFSSFFPQNSYSPSSFIPGVFLTNVVPCFTPIVLI